MRWGISSLNHNEKNDSTATILDIQTANDVLVSDMQSKVSIKELGAFLWIYSVRGSPSVLSLGRLCNELGSSYPWPT